MVVSAARVAANRANAQKSTGPKDTSTTRYNGIQHGLTAVHVILPWENRADFHELVDALVRHYNPIDVAEYLLVKEVAEATWRCQRVKRIEMNLFDGGAYTNLKEHDLQPDEPHKGSLEAQVFMEYLPTFEKYTRYEAHHDRQRRYAEKRLHDCIAARKVLNPQREPLPVLAQHVPCGGACNSQHKLKLASLRKPKRGSRLQLLLGETLRIPRKILRAKAAADLAAAQEAAKTTAN